VNSALAFGPPDADFTIMNLDVGASGYSYKEWKGTFYPDDLPGKQMLHYSGKGFCTVEIKTSTIISRHFWS